MAIHRYKLIGKCKNCGNEHFVNNTPDIYVNHDTMDRDELLISIINSGYGTSIHECEDGKLGIVEAICFEEEDIFGS